MGSVLATRLAGSWRLAIYDRNSHKAAAVAAATGAVVLSGLTEAAACGRVILAVPDKEVLSCLQEFNAIEQELVVFNVATNVPQTIVENAAASHIRCISVKIIGHAGEMALGFDPVIVVNEQPQSLTKVARQIFSAVGHVIVGQADQVTEINTVAAEKALEAAVRIEDELHRRGYEQTEVIQSAISQVAAGILKAYANDDLGPFAKEIVREVQSKMSTNPRR